MTTEHTTVWLFTGIPAAGKTTVARAFAARLPRAAHIEGEALWRQIVSGRETPDPQLAGEAERQYELAIDQQCLLARSYADAGFVPVLDFVVVTSRHLARYRTALAPLALEVVVLAPNLGVTRERDAERGNKTGARFAFLDAPLRRELGGQGLWVDSSRLSVQETVDAILGGRG